jgi:hypothetical protein
MNMANPPRSSADLVRREGSCCGSQTNNDRAKALPTNWQWQREIAVAMLRHEHSNDIQT